MKTVFHPAAERGHANHGWLNAHHSFSFASWYDPNKVQFGALRVLNDDIVAAGMGFGMHPHDNMEIITIPLKGDLQHKDSMGNTEVIRSGDVQVMSAGTGVHHSEFNPNHDQEVRLFQIWIFPEKQQVQPRYDQKTFQAADREKSWQNVVSPDGANGSMFIHQQAWISLRKLKAGEQEGYTIGRNGNGAYIMLIEGTATIAGQKVGKRDAVGIWDTDTVAIQAETDLEILVIDVPMNGSK